ncbi:MAG: hypothetical protein QXS03_01790, partial [Candidatus Micrarchaeaceae archaeon]
MAEKNKAGRPRIIDIPDDVKKIYEYAKMLYNNVTVSKYAGKYRLYYTDYIMDDRKKKKVPLT